MRAEERIRTRIHSFRMPIRNKNLRLFVTFCYAMTPIVGGYQLMQYVVPDAEELRGKIKQPTPEEQAAIDAHKAKLQREMDAALAARRQA